MCLRNGKRAVWMEMNEPVKSSKEDRWQGTDQGGT